MDIFKSVKPISTKVVNVNVTCVKFIDSYILAGQAGHLHIFDVPKEKYQKHEKLHSFQVFDFQNIYGIIPFNINLLVFGGKNVAILTRSSCNYESISIKSSWTAEDWILDAVWSNPSTVTLLTAHNVILQYGVSQEVSLITKVVSDERCIFKIFGSTLDDIVIFAGTVYQELVIWETSKHKQINDAPVLHRLQGHKGVIFCIAFDHETQRIASTSDDRTVRVWSVKFSDDAKTVTDKWTSAEISLLFSAFGHTARVWRCLFTSSGHLTTVGEDSYICLWDEKGNLLNRWEHSGEIWCIDCHKEYIAIGGNGITLRSLSNLPHISSLNISDKGTPRQVVLNSFGKPIIISDKGFLIQHNISGALDSVHDERFSSYSILSNSPCRNYIVLGGVHGHIVLYKVAKDGFVNLDNINIDNNRIYSLTWANEKKLASCCGSGVISIFNIDETYKLQLIQKFILPTSKERWLTCALIIENFFVCGDRMGSLHLYDLSSKTLDPLHSFLKLHGTKGVSDLKYMNELLFSTGRDGTLREVEIVGNKLNLISTLKVPMDWVACIIESNVYGLLIAGFHDVNFVLWSVIERITILALECGGGHRSFDYMIDESNGNLILTYIRMKAVNYMCCPIEKLAHQTILASTHVKSINTACILHSSDGGVVVLTGGEDNSLRLNSIDSTTGCHGYTSYIRHISAVRVVKAIGNIVVSAGARAQIIIWEVTENSTGEVRLKELKSHMIREESEHRKSWKDAEPLIDPETRYMDIDILKTNDDIFTIFAACSDGMLRIFEYNVTSRDLKLTRSIESNQGCLLKLMTYHWKERFGIITAGTKGTVVFWQPPFETMPLKSHPIHPMGINAMDLVIIGNNLILGTGGDDSTVSLTVFSLNEKKTESIVFNIVEHAHTCQVSGLKMNSKFVITASHDQKLCFFSWQFDGSYLKTNLLGYYITSIPDIHGILTWNAHLKQEKDLNILLYGCGFQLVYFNGSAIM